MTGTDRQPEHDARPRSDDTGAREPRLLNRIMELYALTGETRSHTDTESFGLVLERMAYAASLEERAELANRLALTPDAPVRLMRRFAFDTILVARPVLQYSPRLSDSDLTVLARKLDQEYLLAIAHRLVLADVVTDILVERGDSRVVATALHNCGAVFSAFGRLRLAERARADPELARALRLRPDLAPGLADRARHLLAAVSRAAPGGPASGEPETGDTGAESEAVAAAGETRSDSTPPETAQAREGEPFGEEAAPGEDTVYEEIAPDALAAEIAAGAAENGAAFAGEETEGNAEGEDTPAPPAGGEAAPDEPQTPPASERRLVDVARAGLIPDTIASISRLARLEESIVRHCLLQAELSALMVLCKANGLANTTFTTLLKLRTANTGETVDTVAMLKRYEAMHPHTARRIIQFAEKKKRGASAAAAAE